MQIKHLSPKELQHFGEILAQYPSDDSRYKKSRFEFMAAPQIAQYETVSQVILDYVSGMSVLVIYQETYTDIFYLDRIVSLHPGTRFSIMPMSETCCVDLITTQQETFLPIGYIAISQLEDNVKGLQFEKIYTFLYQECSHNFYFRGEKHQPYELVYVDRGQLHNLVGGQDIVLEQHGFMIIDSNDWHTQYSDLPVNFLTISFWAADSGLSAITNKAFSITPQLKGIFEKMLAQNLQETYRNDYIEAQLKILLIELLQKSKPEASAQFPSAYHSENQIVDQAIQIISENLQKKLTLEQLSSMVHVSVPHLCKLFQNHLGTSPGKYINKIRIEECKVLLRDRHLPMSQIADMMGFSSLQQFSRQFHNICGITPTQYVRSLR